MRGLASLPVDVPLCPGLAPHSTAAVAAAAAHPRAGALRAATAAVTRCVSRVRSDKTAVHKASPGQPRALWRAGARDALQQPHRRQPQQQGGHTPAAARPDVSAAAKQLLRGRRRLVAGQGKVLLGHPGEKDHC